VRVDCVRIIEAGYAAREAEPAWLGDLLEPFEPLSGGMGVLGTVYDFQAVEPGPRLWVHSRSTAPELVTAYQRSRRFLAAHHLDVLKEMHRPARGGACWTSKVGMALPEQARLEARAYFAGTGLGDTLGVLVAEPGCPTVTISLPFARTFAVPSRTMEQLRRVTAHLTAAVRLRTRLASAGEQGAAVEAVLDPGGTVHDVRTVERARGRLRRSDPEEALAIWRALFEGRWSIVERTEADGKRFLLAHRNAPGFTDPKALAPGERDVLVYAARGLSNKYIGYLLGVATSTVSTRLASALRKLSLGSRREAIALLGDLPPVPVASLATQDRPEATA
jgi:DNA-binding CsgD family transcriptional regulator